MRSSLLPLILSAQLLVPVAAARQQAAAPGAADEAQALVTEYRGLAEQLGRLQARAMEDEALSRRSDRLVDDVEKAMVERDPATTERLAELDVLRTRLDAAREAQDRDAFEESVARARELSAQLEATRSQVLEEDPYARRTAELQEALVEEMTRLEPSVPAMLARLGQIDRALRGGGGN